VKNFKKYFYKKKILIIGGTGFLGYHLAKHCLKKKFLVTSISKNSPKKWRYLKKGGYIKCDISNKILLKKKTKDSYDYIINLGGYVDHTNKKETFKSHYIGVKNLTDLFIKKKIIKFIQIGSSMEYGRVRSPQNETFRCIPRSIYGVSKYLATKYLLNTYFEKNFPVIILRLYQVYGPYQSFNRLIPTVINSCKNNSKFPCSNGNQKRDFLYVDDLINAIFLSLKKKNLIGKIINIGSGVPIKVKMIIKKIRSYFQKGYPQFGKIKFRPEEMFITYPDIKKARNFLNWKPKENFNTGLKKTIQFYLACKFE